MLVHMLFIVLMLVHGGEPEKNNLPAQITPLTQKSGPVITERDILMRENKQELIFLGTMRQKNNLPGQIIDQI